MGVWQRRASESQQNTQRRIQRRAHAQHSLPSSKSTARAPPNPPLLPKSRPPCPPPAPYFHTIFRSGLCSCTKYTINGNLRYMSEILVPRSHPDLCKISACVSIMCHAVYVHCFLAEPVPPLPLQILIMLYSPRGRITECHRLYPFNTVPSQTAHDSQDSQQLLLRNFAIYFCPSASQCRGQQLILCLSAAVDQAYISLRTKYATLSMRD